MEFCVCIIHNRITEEKKHLYTHVLSTVFSPAAKRCPYPDLLSNGELYYEDTVYQSMINYTCNEG